MRRLHRHLRDNFTFAVRITIADNASTDDTPRIAAALAGDLEGVRLQTEVGDSSWFGFSMIFDGPFAGRRRDIVSAFSAASIDCRPIVAGNFTRNPVMAHLDAIVPDRLPAADAAHDHGLFVGNPHFPIEAELQLLRDTLISVRG